MFEALGHLTFRARRWVLAAAGAFVLVAVTWGIGVFGALSAGGFEDPDAESARAAQRIVAAGLNSADVDAIAVYSDPARTVDDASFQQAVERTVEGLPAEAVLGSATYWSTGQDAFVSADRRTTY